MIIDHRVELGTPTGGLGEGPREYTATLFVESDDCADTGFAVLQYLLANGFQYGSRYQFGNDADDNARLYQIDAPQYIKGSAWTWRAALRYRERRLIGRQTGSVEITSPEQFEPDIKIRTIARQRPIERGWYRGGLPGVGWDIPRSADQTDDNRRLITNSANTPFVPAPEATFHNDDVRVTRRTTGITYDKTSFPRFWINDRDFLLFNGRIVIPVAAYELKFTGWTVDAEEYEGYEVVRVEFSGEMKDGGWREELLDAGTLADGCSENDKHDGQGSYYWSSNYKDEADIAGDIADPPGLNRARHILDRQGIPAVEPALLNGFGEPLLPCSEERYYGEWSYYREIDPTSLGFFAGITALPEEEP